MMLGLAFSAAAAQQSAAKAGASVYVMQEGFVDAHGVLSGAYPPIAIPSDFIFR